MDDFLHTLECVIWVFVVILGVAVTLFFVGAVLVLAFRESVYVGIGVVSIPTVPVIISLIVHILKKKRLK